MTLQSEETSNSALTDKVSASQSANQALFDDNVAKGQTKEAVRLLRSYDDLTVTPEQAWMMLDAIPMDVSEEKETEQQILVSMTYASLRKRNILSGFGAVDVTPEALPLDSKDVDVAGGFTSTKVHAY
jgi:hypothetical protein